MALAFPPFARISEAAFSALSPLISATTTFAPADASRSAIARPIPCAAPVTIADLLVKSRNNGLPFHTIIIDNVIPFHGAGSGNYRHHRLRVAHVEHFMRHARLDEDEIARLVLDYFPASGPVLVSHAPLQNVKHHLEIYVDMSVSHPSGRNGGHVHGEFLRPNILR